MSKRRSLKHRKSVTGTKKSKIETTVSQILDTLHIPYKQHAHINQYSVDFLIGDVIVECYGDYWHCNPQRYAPDYFNKAMHLRAHQRWSKDATRKGQLESWGYRMIVLWEEDIKNNPRQIQNTLRQEVVTKL